MDASVLLFNGKAEYHTDELCYINELSNSPNDPDVSIARARLEAGITTRWHRLHGIAERYIVIEGQALVEVGELAPQEIKCGDAALIPPDCRQRITNIGNGDLIFLAICSPRFQQTAYEDIEDEENAN
jgi:mannose-6-phosphate isomerase-like protein (cupin superfamily)